jgi:hypothetical protein
MPIKPNSLGLRPPTLPYTSEPNISHYSGLYSHFIRTQKYLIRGRFSSPLKQEILLNDIVDEEIVEAKHLSRPLIHFADMGLGDAISLNDIRETKMGKMKRRVKKWLDRIFRRIKWKRQRADSFADKEIISGELEVLSRISLVKDF